MKEVTSAEFDKRMRESLKIKKCKKCKTYSGEVILINPFFGARSVAVVCLGCGNKTGTRKVTDCFADDSRLATPVTAESLAKAIFGAVEEWNDKQTDRQE